MPYRNEPRPVFDARMMIHVSLTAILAWLGFILALPGNTFDTTPAWTLFERLGKESTWSVAFFLVSACGAMGVDTPRRWLKLFSILVLATAHGTCALFFYRGNQLGGATGVFIVIAAQGYYLAWRQAWGYG